MELQTHINQSQLQREIQDSLDRYTQQMIQHWKIYFKQWFKQRLVVYNTFRTTLGQPKIPSDLQQTFQFQRNGDGMRAWIPSDVLQSLSQKDYEQVTNLFQFTVNMTSMTF